MRAPLRASSSAISLPIRFAAPVINATLPLMFMNKVAMITGASRGIGFAIARKLHQDGASVALCARSTIRDFPPERSLALTMDIRDPGSVDAGIRRIVDRFGKIDIVVNNAGISGVIPVDFPDTAAWLDVIQTNVIGTYYVTHSAVPHMPDGGRIIMISSVLGKFGVPGYTAYFLSNVCLYGLSLACAL